jgi:hypothetical protein
MKGVLDIMSVTRVSDLSIDELKSIIREVVEQTITDLFVDPDEGLELRQDIQISLRKSIESIRSGEKSTVSVQQVAENLDLEW